MQELQDFAGQADHLQTVALACQCARLALRYITQGEDRPLKAIEAAEAWVANPNPLALKQACEAAGDARIYYLGLVGTARYRTVDERELAAVNAAYSAAYAVFGNRADPDYAEIVSGCAVEGCEEQCSALIKSARERLTG